MFVDTHAHLIMPEFDYSLNPEEILKSSVKAGVGSIWLASTNKVDIVKNIEMCNFYPSNLKSWVGFHPEEYVDFDSSWLDKILDTHSTRSKPLTKAINQLPVVGVGEVGVDLKWHKKHTLNNQQQVFEDQIVLANKYNLPVSIHSRNAAFETIEVMQKYKKTKFLWHCYNLDTDKTRILLKDYNNIYFGFNAIITYKSGAYIMDSLKLIPENKILFETDSPFLAPRPFKYKYNTPEGVISVYKFVAEHKGIVLNEFAKQVYSNVESFLAV